MLGLEPEPERKRRAVPVSALALVLELEFALVPESALVHVPCRSQCPRYRRRRGWHCLRHLHLAPVTDLTHHTVQPTFERSIVVLLRIPHRIPASQAQKVHLNQRQTEENTKGRLLFEEVVVGLRRT